MSKCVSCNLLHSSWEFLLVQFNQRRVGSQLLRKINRGKDRVPFTPNYWDLQPLFQFGWDLQLLITVIMYFNEFFTAAVRLSSSTRCPVGEEIGVKYTRSRFFFSETPLPPTHIYTPYESVYHIQLSCRLLNWHHFYFTVFRISEHRKCEF